MSLKKLAQSSGRDTVCRLLPHTPSPCNCRVLLSQELFLLLLRVEKGTHFNLDEEVLNMACLTSI